MYSHYFFSTVAALLFGVAAAVTPTPPAQDPFYSQPANISSYKPGAIVRGRTIDPKVQGLLPLTNITVGAAYQYMYRTTDSLGNSVGSVMTYLVPQKPDNSKLLSISFAYDSPNSFCDPSYTIRPGANSSIGPDLITVEAALDNGWHIVASDYEGLKSEVIAGVQAGHAVLDSLRASLNQTVRASTKLSPTAKYALYGYSGGALAAEWATEMQSSYASDLTNLVGTAIGGLTPNITSVLLTINKGPNVFLAFISSLGLSRAYPNLNTYIQQQLLPSKSSEYYAIAEANVCGGFSPPQYTGLDFFSYFKAGMNILYSSAYMSTIAAGGIMGRHGVPRVPMFVYKADGDEISPVADTDELMAQYCGQGVTFDYQRNTFGDHATDAILGFPAAFSWLKDRLSGVPLSQPTRCYIQNVTVTDIANSGADAAFGTQIIALLQAALGNL